LPSIITAEISCALSLSAPPRPPWGRRISL